jgi:TRAP-type C4-dicarboxylate transport system permease small subunit|tara:strand:+ start:961 stop:1455 length:495 start_codon:yes stop_codon:yes gene_type:complete
VKLIERLASHWALLGGIVVFAIMIVTSVNVGAFGLDRIARMYGTNISALPGYEDFVKLAISGAALMFFPYCQLQRGHVVVDLFASSFPAGIVRFLDRLWLVAIVLLALFLTYWMILGMAETRDDSVLSPVLGWPEWPFYLPGIASLILWACVAILQAVRGDSHV